MEWGHLYNCKSEGDFDSKLTKLKLLNREIQQLDLEINTAIGRAIEGQDPETIIQIDDPKLNLEVYQQIVSKVYAVTRYRVYQKIQTKQRLQR